MTAYFSDHRQLNVRVKFVWRDIWIGAYIEAAQNDEYAVWFKVYICILPCLPIIVEYVKNRMISTD